jgi:NAD(P)-dependent dehydrogenase (short-subunit alcohol dehydrogenase family)
MKLQGRVMLVTGGALRLGRAISLLAAERGATLAIHHRSSTDAARRIVGELRGRGLKARAFRADLGRPNGPERLARRVEDELGPVSALVNSASVYEKTPLATLTSSQWDQILAVNLRAPALLSRALGLSMKKRREGAIVNLGDWSIPRPYANYAAYAASKAGLEALTRVLARELAPEVRVNMVSPGAILPPKGATRSYIKAVGEAAALGRMGRPEDIAEAVLFLIEKADYTTGETLLVDGGRSLK